MSTRRKVYKALAGASLVVATYAFGTQVHFLTKKTSVKEEIYNSLEASLVQENNEAYENGEISLDDYNKNNKSITEHDYDFYENAILSNEELSAQYGSLVDQYNKYDAYTTGAHIVTVSAALGSLACTGASYLARKEESKVVSKSKIEAQDLFEEEFQR